MSSPVGVGLRPTHYSYLLEQRESLPNWFEVVSENYLSTEGRPIQVLEEFRKRAPIALHGVSLSIGSSDPLNRPYLLALKKLVDRIEPCVVSDHLCWTGIHEKNLHDLIPIAFTEETLNFLTSRVQEVQDFLGRQILLENVSSYFQYRSSTYQEWAFINELAKRSGCGILLDVNNVYVSAMNHGFDPFEYLRGILPEFIRQIHISGFTDMGTHLFDTHSKPAHPVVWELFDSVIQKNADIPFMFEWDDEIPEFPKVEEELKKAVKIWSQHHGN